MPIWYTQNTGEFCLNPDSFNPERWQSDDKRTPELLTFGVGPRMCPGKIYAVALTALTVAFIVHYYRLDQCDTTSERTFEVRYNLASAKLTNGAWIRLTRRA